MDQITLTVDESPSPDDVEAVNRGLDAYNAARTGTDDARKVGIFLRDETGQIVGGLCGWTWWGWLSIDTLWLDEAARGRGYGTRLVQQAEDLARARGCRHVILNTMSFQAPDFYRKLGYTEYATLDGFAGPHRRHHFTKVLGDGRDVGSG